MVPLLDRRALRLVHRATASATSHLRVRAHEADELSHYSSGTSDIEYLFPIGWSELEGIANRGDFDLTAHTEASGTKLEWVDSASGERFTPAVVEPARGLESQRSRLPLRRLRRGGRGRARAHRPAAAPGDRSGEGGRPPADPAQRRDGVEGEGRSTRSCVG